MANTFDPALVVDTLSAKALTILGSRLAPVGAFSRDFTTDSLVQGGNVKVPKVTAGSTKQKNPTNWESGDSTVGYTSVTVDAYSKSFHITSQQYNQGFRLEQLAEKNLIAFADDLMDVIMAPITTANFGSPAKLVVAQASLSTANLKTLWGNIAKSPQKNLLLDGIAFSNFLPTDRNAFVPGMGAYGYDGMYLNTRWSAAAANSYGFACGPDALAIAAGIPEQVPGLSGALIDQRTITLEGLGLSVQLNVWVSTATRALWASYDVMLGAAAGDTTVGQIIATA